MLLSVVLALGFYMRTEHHQKAVFTLQDGKKTIAFAGPDSYYHMRRAQLIANNYPSLPYRDNYLFYPKEGLIPWAGGFDIFLGTIIWGLNP